MKMIVEAFEVEGETPAEVAWKVARHFGTVADGIPSDAGVAIAVRFEYPPVVIEEATANPDAAPDAAPEGEAV